MQGRGFEGEHGWYLNTDWHRLNGWVIGKQILRKSVLNLCFASSSILAERYMEQIFWRPVLIGGPLFGKEANVGKPKDLRDFGFLYIFAANNNLLCAQERLESTIR